MENKGHIQENQRVWLVKTNPWHLDLTQAVGKASKKKENSTSSHSVFTKIGIQHDVKATRTETTCSISVTNVKEVVSLHLTGELCI